MLLLGRLADLAGWREREVAASSLSELRRLLAVSDPILAEALAGPSVQTAVDKALVRGEAALTATSEVAFLPPMSGG